MTNYTQKYQRNITIKDKNVEMGGGGGLILYMKRP